MNAAADCERIIEFVRSHEEKLATRIEPFEWGTAYLDARYPLRWDSNFLRATRSLEGVTAETLAAEADRILGGAGLSHREIIVEHAADGERLAPAFAALGFECEDLAVMTLRRKADRPRDLALVEEVDVETFIPAARNVYRRTPHISSEEVARSLADFKRVLAAVGARFFVARVEGEIASMCELYWGKGVAQVEDVCTLEEYRGRGLAASVVLRATREARRDGCDLVFLLADRADWPKDLYARLGFDPICRFFSFVLQPAAGAGPKGGGRFPQVGDPPT
ncbi:MAG: GNAT family N-acetyltransferase [Actinomycetota bacterium]